MANYPGYLWYLLYNDLGELFLFFIIFLKKREKKKELEQNRRDESYTPTCFKTIYTLVYMRICCIG